MPLKKRVSKKAFNYNVSQLIKDGYSTEQAVAIAYSIKKGKRKKWGR